MQTLERVFAAVALLVAVVPRSTAFAHEAPAAEWLTWERGPGAESCPDARAFQEMIEERLQSDAPAPATSPMRVVARIERSQDAGSSWHAEIHLLNPANTLLGSRVISRDEGSCAPTAKALALVAALLLSNPPSSEPGPEPPPARPSRPPPPAPVLPAAPPEPPFRAPAWTLGAQLEALGSLGLLPGLRPGGQLRLSVQPADWPELHATFARWLETEMPIGDTMSVRLNLWRTSLGASPWSWHGGPVEVGMALGPGVGRMHAEGFGYPGARSSNRWLFDFEAGGWIRGQLVGGLFAVASANIVVPLVRAHVTYTGPEGATAEAFRATAVGGLGCLGLVYLFSS